MENRNKSYLAETPYRKRFSQTYDFAHTKASLVGIEVADMLDSLNGLIADLADQIKAEQPNTVGSVTLHLKTCSSSGCQGCPHPHWLKWFNPSRGRNRKLWTSEKVQSPFRQKRDISPELREIYNESIKVIAKRKKFLAAIRSLSTQVTWINSTCPESEKAGPAKLVKQISGINEKPE